MADGTIQYMARDIFTYSVEFLSLAPGTSSTQSILIQADSDFIWQKAAYFADTDSDFTLDTMPVPRCSVAITDSGSNRLLMDRAVPVPSIFGRGELPFILPKERIFLARTQILVQVSNFSSTSTYNLRLAFIGQKGFRA